MGDMFQANASLDELAGYLEGFGIVGLPVINDAGSENIYSIDFQFDPESSDSFHTALKKMGLSIKTEERSIVVLVLSRNE